MKFKVGDCFISDMDERIVITGYNHILKDRYNTTLYYKRNPLVFSKFITDAFLDSSCVIMTPEQKQIFVKANVSERGTVELMGKSSRPIDVAYRVWYIDKSQKVDGKWKGQDLIIMSGGVKSLAKRLNRLVSLNPQYKIVNVSILGDDGKIIKNVRFMPKEFKEQKFIVGYKARLLAYAKHELGYEITV